MGLCLIYFISCKFKERDERSVGAKMAENMEGLGPHILRKS